MLASRRERAGGILHRMRAPKGAEDRASIGMKLTSNQTTFLLAGVWPQAAASLLLLRSRERVKIAVPGVRRAAVGRCLAMPPVRGFRKHSRFLDKAKFGKDIAQESILLGFRFLVTFFADFQRSFPNLSHVPVHDF